VPMARQALPERKALPVLKVLPGRKALPGRRALTVRPVPPAHRVRLACKVQSARLDLQAPRVPLVRRARAFLLAPC
jgi:hypothetical protein